MSLGEDTGKTIVSTPSVSQDIKIEDKSNADSSEQPTQRLNDTDQKASGASTSDNVDVETSEADRSNRAITRDADRGTNLLSERGKFLCVHFVGTIDNGYFEKVNDVYIKYSIICGPDWILSSGDDVGITQIARYRISEDGAQKFVWNQPISVSYRSFNYYGWPQIVLSVYHYDLFGNDQILGYGCTHLPISNQHRTNQKLQVQIYSPQSSSIGKQLISWITGRKPELVDANLFARGDCRSVLQTVTFGLVELDFSLTTKDVSSAGFRS